MINEAERKLMLETIIVFTESFQELILESIPANLSTHERACLFLEITRAVWFKLKFIQKQGRAKATLFRAIMRYSV